MGYNQIISAKPHILYLHSFNFLMSAGHKYNKGKDVFVQRFVTLRSKLK